MTTPLLDHFRPPLYPARHWEAFHGQWAASIVNGLNSGLLPAGYFAEIQVHIGSRVEVDIGTFERESALGARRTEPNAGGGTATLPVRAYAPPVPAFSMPALYPDSLEVLVINSESGVTLVGAVELVSPGNKDRPEFRRAFAAKCAAYLQQGVGLVIVDIVTTRQANLHNELIDLLQAGDSRLMPPDDLYTTAYRPIRRPDTEQIDVWTAPLAVGQPLPTMPLGLDKGLCVPVDLGTAYAEACQRSRLP